MKLQFKYQQFQAEAARAVVDIFAGQPCLNAAYRIDEGYGNYQLRLGEGKGFTGWGNAKIVPSLQDRIILKQLNKVQRKNQIAPSPKLEGHYNFTIEMETGVGKTYTYIKTMYELNRHYGWCKFIVVVPSIAIREGVYKSFQVTQEHFAEEYGKKIHFFIYNSARLAEIDRFASDNALSVMIINSQAFNAKGKDARRIYMKLDEFRSRRPIDVIAGTNPILVIDEPQSVEGKQTKERLKDFRPLFTLRYSATHRADSIYNMVYRLDAMEAYNKKLVKRIAVKGITENGIGAGNGYLYLESVNLSHEAPTATIQFDFLGKSGIRKRSVTVGEGYNIYDNSGNTVKLEEYRDGYIVKFIDGRDDSVEFVNGLRLQAGDVIGKVSEEEVRRIQIRETILSHIERERRLFRRGIKVLSLFFIDEVNHYRQYDSKGQALNGIFADMFEEEYKDVVSHLRFKPEEEGYQKYLESITASNTHAGYFSVDKKGHLTDSKVNDRSTRTSDDIDAYDLIMKNKELLLELDPKKSPVRFIFSHSALREGWDNPNVFQICTLKQSGSDVRKRQEVGRGLRLCVNQNGLRMDENILGRDVHKVNVLTVIASESYDSFARTLQTELSEAVAARPKQVTAELFKERILQNTGGYTWVLNQVDAERAVEALMAAGYVDSSRMLTDKYYEDKAAGEVFVSPTFAGFEASIIDILDCVYNSRALLPDNARSSNIEISVNRDKLAMPQFQKLWEHISSKSAYMVKFDEEELISKAVALLNEKLRVSKLTFRVETGVMNHIDSREALENGEAFSRTASSYYSAAQLGNASVRYDLLGRLVEDTGLTRMTIARIMCGIEKKVFDQFKDNPEEFLLKAGNLIQEQKAMTVIQNISYEKLGESYKLDVLTNVSGRGKLGENAIKAKKSIYDYVICDSKKEMEFARDLDIDETVAAYAKLPSGYYISTPMGRYNPDWAIAFYEGTEQKTYFVAETKANTSQTQLRLVEYAKIQCAAAHYKAVGDGAVGYGEVSSYEEMKEKVG